MHLIKGFFESNTQISNEPHTTAMFGELSATARTYGKDLKEYSSNLYSNLNLILFHSKENNQIKELDISLQSTILEVGNWIYNLGDSITANTTTLQLVNNISNQFNNTIHEVNVGNIQYDTFKRLPTWISFKFRNTIVETRVKIWLSNEVFEREYDEYEIKIIPPFENIDQFFMPPTDLKELIKNINNIELMDRINQVKGDYPYTLIRAENTTYINPNDITDTVNIYWTAIIYGKAGDDSEIIKQAIIKYITDHSRSSETEWKQILPDLFNITAFYIVPRWDKEAIPDRKTIPGIYSPISNHKEIFEFTKEFLKNLVSASHIENNLEVTVHRFKSISLAIVGGEDNRRSLYRISDYFNDYIAEESTHEDFNRQKKLTKEWTNLITELLIKAEHFETNPILPTHTRLVNRHGKNYLVRKFDNVEYFLALKSSVVI